MDHIKLPLPDDLKGRIDEVRGSMPRTVWIRWAAEQVLDDLDRQRERARFMAHMPNVERGR